MPMDTIQRAIQRGVGGGEGAALEEVFYEAYGAGGAALLIEATTDNRNRTVADVRATLTRGGGSLGEAGSVSWNFESHWGHPSPSRPGSPTPRTWRCRLSTPGADDFTVDGHEVEVLTEPTQVSRAACAGSDRRDGGKRRHRHGAQTQIDLPNDQTSAVMRLVERLEDLDDVTRVYTNVHISDEILAEAAG